MIVHPTDPPMDPHSMIRTDLWNTMTLTELHHQQELMVDRLNHLQIMMSTATGAPQTVVTLYHATYHAYTQLNALVDKKSGGNVNA
jgi:hypothetical protein